ncbi:MAG TPA: hypothetical protein DDY58_01890 [Terrisporobacter glycolicus]|uniref:hypothetical protein n=1 Tax=Terrisporobacter TaxID=1505652 RepID=UPI000E82056F|nr:MULTISPECIES: hypothetical protein [Terrisporobacter]HBI91277.1 hypothetical protein [Terrisporobacter hibernicus]
MLFNRAYINELKSENERLKRKKEEYEDGMIRSMSSKDSYKKANIKLINDIGNLKKDIESKENSVCNLLEANKELSQHNNYLQNQNLLLNNENVKLIKESNQKDRRLENQRINLKIYREQIKKLCEEKSMLEKVIRKHEENECRLNTKLCRVQGQLDKIDNYTRMLEGREIDV